MDLLKILLRPSLPRLLRSGLFVWACFFLMIPAPSLAKEGIPVDIGVLSYRSIEETRKAWAPTAEWLDQQIPGYRFRIIPMFFDDLTQAVAERQVSFVMTNPEHFVLLHAGHGLNAVATLMPLAGDSPTDRFGGVIFARADRADLQHLVDLRGKRISAVSKNSMGGFLAQHWTLFKAGIDLREDVALTFTGMPHDNVVDEVLAGRADVGLVRTGVLESRIAAGRLDAKSIKLLNPRMDSGFPLMLSTDLFPEWPFAAMPGIPPDLEKAVTLALLKLPANADAAVKGDYFGFSPPANYAEVEALMVRLGLHPYRDKFGWRDVFERYARWISLLLAGFVLTGFLVTYLMRRTNHALNAALDRTRELAGQRTLLLSSLGEGVYGVDRQGHCDFINPAALAMLGFDMREVIGQDQHALFHHHKPDGSAYPHQECPIYLTLQDGIRRDVRGTFLRKDDTAFPVRMTATSLHDGHEISGAVVVFQDISDETQRLQRLQLLEAALNAAANGIVITDAKGTIEWVNPAMSRLTGYQLQETVGQNPRILKSGIHQESYYGELWQTIAAGRVWHGEVINKRKDGSLYHEEMTVTPVLDAQGITHHYVAVKQDVSARKRMEDELRQLATTDSLTGIANRRFFLQRATEELQRFKRYGGSVALLMLDLDHFKRINDTWGHAIGDRVLRHFTDQVQEHLRGTDILGRLGGEEFALLLPGAGIDGACGLAERLRQGIVATPVVAEAGEVAYTVSIGVTMLDARDNEPDAALARADAALYRAKESGRNRVEKQLVTAQ